MNQLGGPFDPDVGAANFDHSQRVGCIPFSFSPVTTANPAKAGEVLIAEASSLGPTVPGVDPGKPFPTNSPFQVNSPVQVTVNGVSAEVINTIGWPGLVNTYRVDFRMPAATTAGTTSIQITAVWVAGPAVGIAAQ
jgi:uncharacterized protein (TIGR03437 family)